MSFMAQNWIDKLTLPYDFSEQYYDLRTVTDFQARFFANPFPELDEILEVKSFPCIFTPERFLTIIV